MEVNEIYQGDTLELLRQLPDNSVDLIITSPPYNLTGFNGVHKRNSRHNWDTNIAYSGTTDLDNMPEEEYEKNQIEVLNECYRVLKPLGSMFYNHKIRVRQQQISHPLEWISKSKFRCRQEIIWDRLRTHNINGCRYLPTTERIYWLCKGKKNPLFKRQSSMTEVWTINYSKSPEHPAPFPIEIPDHIIPHIKAAYPRNYKITVLDPYCGTGTVCVSAKKHGCNWLGFDIVQEYVDMSRNRLNNI